jgi:hypothetical protein
MCKPLCTSALKMTVVSIPVQSVEAFEHLQPGGA